MITPLNEKVSNFFKGTSIENITIESIEACFKNIQETNEYGGLLHACVNNKFQEEKVLKFIRILLENGLSPNNKGKSTGYTFIHLALYGYTSTQDNKDYSYSTEFICELIKVAKEYGLDVNITDSDSDSIIHTALASEIYTGSTVELIKQLVPEFNLSIKDNDGRNIYEALEEYEKEAIQIKNVTWSNRLRQEKEKIFTLVRQDIDATNENLMLNLKEKLEKLRPSIDINFILHNSHDIISIYKKLEALKVNESSFAIDFKEFDNFIKDVINIYLEKLEQDPNFSKINELHSVIEQLPYSDTLFALDDVKIKYEKEINQIENEIKISRSFNYAKALSRKIDLFNEQEVKDSLRKMLDNRLNTFNNKISSIMKLNFLITLSTNWLNGELNKDLVTEDQEQFKLIEKYKSLELKKLDIVEKKLVSDLNEQKETINNVAKNRFRNIISSLAWLVEQNFFTETEMNKVVTNMLDSYQKSCSNEDNNKVKRKC